MFEDLLDWVGGLYDKLWPFSQRPWDEQPDWVKRGLEALTVLLFVLLFLFFLAWLIGPCSDSGSSSEPPTSSGGSDPVRTTAATDVVHLHVVVNNRPPCTVLPMLNLTIAPDADQPAQDAEEHPGDLYPGPCHWDLAYRAGTALTWSLRGTSTNGWGIPYTWVGESSGPNAKEWCRGSFTITRTHPQPTEQETKCNVTLTTDATFTVTYQTYAAGINEGVPYLTTAVYPNCLPGSATASFKPEPEPCEGG